MPLFEDFVTNLVASSIITNTEKQKQYLDDDIINDINKTANLGGEVNIDYENKIIYIKDVNDTEYTLSGTTFDELIEDIPHGVDSKKYLLWLSQKW